MRTRLVHGGSGNFQKQKREIAQIVDILVATPERLLVYYKNNDIKFGEVSHIVVDEADMMLTQGYAELYEMFKIVEEKSRHKANLRYILSTASITKPLYKVMVAEPRFKDLYWLESKSLHRPQANCKHTMLMTKGRDKLDMLIQLLQAEMTDRVTSQQTLVFCNTIKAVESVTHNLKESFRAGNNYRKIGMLTNHLETHERESELKRFNDGELTVLICSDIAQRGLDFAECSHIINFDFPLNSIDYLHRAGRTARYGTVGKVTNLVKKGDGALSKAIQRSAQLGKPIDELSGDKRDYFRGGSLEHLMARHPHSSGAARGLPPPKEYDGSLR